MLKLLLVGAGGVCVFKVMGRCITLLCKKRFRRRRWCVLVGGMLFFLFVTCWRYLCMLQYRQGLCSRKIMIPLQTRCGTVLSVTTIRCILSHSTIMNLLQNNSIERIKSKNEKISHIQLSNFGNYKVRYYWGYFDIQPWYACSP